MHNLLSIKGFNFLRKSFFYNFQFVFHCCFFGIAKPKQEMQDSSLPLALNQYLSDQPNIRTVHLCLDNDIGGRLATDALKLVLSERYGIEVKERFPPGGKDYNDYLCDLLGLQRTTRKAKATISLRPNMEVEKGGNDDRKIEHYTR